MPQPKPSANEAVGVVNKNAKSGGKLQQDSSPTNSLAQSPLEVTIPQKTQEESPRGSSGRIEHSFDPLANTIKNLIAETRSQDKDLKRTLSVNALEEDPHQLLALLDGKLGDRLEKYDSESQSLSSRNEPQRVIELSDLKPLARESNPPALGMNAEPRSLATASNLKIMNDDRAFISAGDLSLFERVKRKHSELQQRPDFRAE
jgi:hypothetical protein